jgi:cell division protein ZapE
VNPFISKGVVPGTVPSVAYDRLAKSGVLRVDPHQREVLPHLDALHTLVSAESKSRGLPGGFIKRAGGSRGGMEGLYMWGGTGCGKTMLMDLFLACVPLESRAKRVHFHAFMQDVNARLHRQRKAGVRGDPLASVAKELIGEAWMLAFDEVQVTDVGDALILRRLFEGLYEGGLVMLSTSNRPTKDLYAGGLQRDLFMPFLHLLQARCREYHLSSPTDHRLQAMQEIENTGGGGAGSGGGGPSRVWIYAEQQEEGGGVKGRGGGGATTPQGVSQLFEEAWGRAVRGEGGVGVEQESLTTLPVEGQGRMLEVPRSVPSLGLARFTFKELCSAYRGAGDYAAIAKAFKHVFMEDVPVLGLSERNELRRLVTLVDILYDNRVKLTVSAAAPPFATFRVDLDEGSGASGGGSSSKQPSVVAAAVAQAGRITVSSEDAKRKYDEVFAWDRAVSRL